MLHRADWAQFRPVCARSHRIPRARRECCTLQAPSCKQWNNDVTLRRWAEPVGWESEPFRNSPGREHHWTKCGLEFNSFLLNGSVSRERCWTQRCLGIICGENAYASSGAAVERKTQPWLKHAQRPRLRSLGRRDVDVPLLGFLFLTFSCTRLHLTEPWRVTKESAFLEPAGFRKHKAPWPGRAEVSCTILTHLYFMLSLASYPCFHTRAVTVKVEHFWRSRRKRKEKNNNNEQGWGLFLFFYHFIKAAGCSGILPKLSRSSPVNHRRVFRRRSRASPGQPHTNMRAGERRVVRRCTAALIRLNLLPAWLSFCLQSTACLYNPFLKTLTHSGMRKN